MGEALTGTEGVGALVINLRRSPQRWAATNAALEGAGLGVERIDALDARVEPTSSRYDARRNRATYFAPLKPAEIACFCSHRRAWERVVALGRPMLVCEDDLEIDGDLVATLEALKARFEGAAAVKLYAKRRPSGASETLGASRLVRPRLVPLGCVAVWMTPGAATRYLAASRTFHEPVDVFAQRLGAHGVATWVLDPAPVREVSARLGGTTLAAPRRADGTRPLAPRILRELRRPAFRARLALDTWRGRR